MAQKEFERGAGILMHISSLPSPYGIGSFGTDAYEFVDWYLKAYYTRGISYYQLKNYSKAISDFTSYIKEVGNVIQYCDFPQMELLLANSYYLRVISMIESKTLPLNSRDGMIQVFGNLEAAIRIYSK